jgi:hypothetical protein
VPKARRRSWNAFSDAHHLSLQLLALGHEVKLVPGQFVKPFLKGQ